MVRQGRMLQSERPDRPKSFVGFIFSLLCAITLLGEPAFATAARKRHEGFETSLRQAVRNFEGLVASPHERLAVIYLHTYPWDDTAAVDRLVGCGLPLRVLLLSNAGAEFAVDDAQIFEFSDPSCAGLQHGYGAQQPTVIHNGGHIPFPSSPHEPCSS